MTATGMEDAAEMGTTDQVEDLRNEIERALCAVRHDRWLLGCQRLGRLWVLCDSRRPRLAPLTRCTRITALARRSLYERLPITVTSICPPGPADPMRDWEIDWPSLVYVPVARRRKRADGLLILGTRQRHWYRQEDIDFLTDLGEVISPWLDDISRGEPAARQEQAA